MRESRKIRDRDCDFFIFIGMDNDRNIKGVFIVPKSIVGKKQVLSEPVVRKRINSRTTLNLRDWEDRWDLLTSQKQRNTRPK